MSRTKNVVYCLTGYIEVNFDLYQVHEKQPGFCDVIFHYW